MAKELENASKRPEFQDWEENSDLILASHGLGQVTNQENDLITVTVSELKDDVLTTPVIIGQAAPAITPSLKLDRQIENIAQAIGASFIICQLRAISNTEGYDPVADFINSVKVVKEKFADFN